MLSPVKLHHITELFFCDLSFIHNIQQLSVTSTVCTGIKLTYSLDRGVAGGGGGGGRVVGSWVARDPLVLLKDIWADEQ